jgi:hypothetical protein
MKIASKVLNSIQLVAGCDLHDQLPAPPPMAPHVVVAMMSLASPATSKISATVKAGWGYALGREHDLGPGPYHFATNLLLPLISLAAGNKAEFGCASVQIGGCGVPPTSAQMAVAIGGLSGVNLQLDCGDPLPGPTSTCIASLNTVHAGLTGADVLAGAATMVVDSAITWFVAKLSGALTAGAFRGVGRVLRLLGIEELMDATFQKASREPVKMLLGWFFGTPLGYSLPAEHHHWLAPGSTYGSNLDRFIEQVGR